MTSCGDIRARALRGEALSGPEVEAHLTACAACAELARGPGALLEALRHPVAPSAGELASLLDGVHAELDADDSALGRVKSLPTRARIAVALFGTALVIGVLALVAPRPDLGEVSRAHFALLAAAISALAAVALPLALRPAHRPALSRAAILAAWGAAVGALALLALVPSPSTMPMPAMPGGAPSVLGAALGCFRLGALLALPVYALVRVLDRGSSRLGAVLAAVYAGVAANLALQLHCPNGQSEHLMLGHVSLVVLLGAVTYGLTELAVKKRGR